jgi:replication factor A1
MFDNAAERWHKKIEENKIYLFSNGRVAMANKKFTSIKNDFALTFGNDVEINE